MNAPKVIAKRQHTITPCIPAGIDAVDYDGYDQESSDDEVDVASLNLGFTPMTLSSRGPMSPIQAGLLQCVLCLHVV